MTAGPGAPAAAVRPRLLRSLASAVLMDGNGDAELLRETRGALEEWGGVYAQLIRLTGPWRLSLFDGTATATLSACRSSGAPAGDRWHSEHRFGRLSISQEIAPVERPAGAVRRLVLSLDSGPPLPVVVTSTFVPYLLPTMVEGIRPVSFRASIAPDGLAVRQHGFGLVYRSDVEPTRLTMNAASWLGGRRAGPISEIGVDHDLVVPAGGSCELRCAIVGGLERELDRATSDLAALLADPELPLAAAERNEAEWLAGTPTVRFAEAPELERAYANARAALRRLYVAPGDSLTGLVAGYPWYSAIWCRDLAWMLPAVVWLGDSDWAARSIDSVLRFQARAELPLLGGAPGELPMQISPGPVFLYGTSDTSLYFPALIDRIVRHTGDRSLAGRWAEAVGRIIDWGTARADPATGLLRNGGEAERISVATGDLARVRYGIDSPDTTIWDSADRRDHAIDIQVLWIEALRAAADLALEAGRPADGAGWRTRAETLAGRVAAVYDWPAEQYLYDSLRDGAPVAQLRPNALIALRAGLLPAERGRAVVARASQDDLLAAWGMRTLSTRDPSYRPDAYHEGQVWTIATAWLAEGAFRVGDAARGHEALSRIAARFEAEDGDANECYRGDRAEPFNSCFLLGLSVAPFLTALFEGLWGLRVDARVPRLEVRPTFPAGWHSASIDGLRLGSGTVALRYADGSVTVTWSGPGPLQVVGPTAERAVAAGEAGRLDVTPGSPGPGRRASS